MDKVRINLNVSQQIKDTMQDKATANNQTLTDFIVARCTADDPQPVDNTQELDQLKRQLETLQINHANALQMYDQQLRILQDSLHHKQVDHEALQANYNQLQQRYDFTLQAMVWHSLPWYKKIGKRLELPNKD